LSNQIFQFIAGNDRADGFHLCLGLVTRIHVLKCGLLLTSLAEMRKKENKGFVLVGFGGPTPDNRLRHIHCSLEVPISCSERDKA